MFVYIYVCKHQITYIILLIKGLQKKNKQKDFQTYMFYCFSAFGFTNCQTY